MRHALLLGSVEHDCDTVSLGIGMHHTINENTTSFGFLLLQDAAGTLTFAVCSRGH